MDECQKIGQKLTCDLLPQQGIVDLLAHRRTKLVRRDPTIVLDPGRRSLRRATFPARRAGSRYLAMLRWLLQHGQVKRADEGLD
jgi:hypothetical protein